MCANENGLTFGNWTIKNNKRKILFRNEKCQDRSMFAFFSCVKKNVWMLVWYLKRVVCILTGFFFTFCNLSVLVIIRYVFIVKCSRISIWIYTLIIIMINSIIHIVSSCIRLSSGFFCCKESFALPVPRRHHCQTKTII